MKNLLFDNWHQWWVCFCSGVKKALWGICRIITCIIFGIISIFVWLWKLVCRFVGYNPGISLSIFVIILAITWLLFFTCNRAKIVGLESQRDSIAWQYQHFKESHGYE